MNFRTFLYSSACAMALCAGHAHAATDDVVEFDSVAAFHAYADGSTNDITDLKTFHLAAYYCDSSNPDCPADGGEGLFLRQNDGSCDDDGGSVLKVTNHGDDYCYYRQNLNGDIRQFGATKGSQYDCSPEAGGVNDCVAMTHAGPGHPTKPWNKLVDAAAAAGLHRLTLAGLQLLTDETVTVPVSTELDLGGAAPFSTADGLLDIPGTIFLPHGFTVAMSERSGIRNGLILPTWYDGVKDDIEELYEYRQNMYDNGDTGLTCESAVGCIIRDMAVDGFDTAVEVRHAPYTTLNNVSADGNVCYWTSATGGNMRWSQTSCNSEITRSTEELQFYAISAIAEETTAGTYAGTCKVTLSPDPGTLHEGYIIWGRGATAATGGTNINNRYHVHLTGTSGVVDLIGSSCHGSNLDEESSAMSASWTAGDRMLHVTSADHIQAGDTIASGSAAVNGLHVTGVWASKNVVILDTAPASSGSGTLTARGGTYNNAVDPCTVTDGSPSGVCLVLDASARLEANGTGSGSLGGQKAEGIGTGYLIGGPVPNHEEDDDSIAGFQMSLSHAFSHGIAYHIEIANNTMLANAAQDQSGTYSDTGRIFAQVDGDSNDASIVGGTGQKSGTGIYVDLATDTECFNYVAGNDSAAGETNALFDVENGCFIAQGMRPDHGNGFIANTASNVSFTGSYLPDVDVFYEGDTARSHTSTVGAVVGMGENNRMDGVTRVESGNLGVGVAPADEVFAPLEIVSTGTSTTASASLTSTYTGTLDVGSTTGFPSTGVMLITNEAIAYTVVDSNTVNITQRSVWGTTNVSHASGDTISYFAEIDGHADNALPAFAVTSLGNIWWSGHTTTTGSTPALSGTGSGVSSGGTITGNDNAGRVTVGSSPTGTVVTVTFARDWTTVPVCFAMDETTLGVNPIFVTNETKSLVQFKTTATPTAADKISYTCTGFR